MPAHSDQRTDRYASWAATALGASIPLTVALNNILLVLTLAAWIVSGSLRGKAAAFRHPAAVPALVLFALICLGMLYGSATAASKSLHARKYLDLLLIPVFVFLFMEHRARVCAVRAFALSLAGILATSYLVKLGLPLALPSFQGNVDYPVIFKERVTHNIVMAFGVFLFAWLGLSAVSRWTRRGWGLLSVLAAINVMAMVPGATGYLILAALSLLLGYGWLRWRGMGAAALLIALCVAGLAALPNPFQQRIGKIAAEVQQWHMDRPADSSPGLRLEFYRTTLAIIAEYPLTGVGTGGFPSAYEKLIRDTEKRTTQNPHNEFLLMWAQLGIAGLVVFIWMFWRLWQLAAQLPTRLESELARGLVVTMVIGCMLNSLLLDHTEGLFYAWLTGVLYGGLKSGTPDSAAQSASRPASATPV